LTVTNQQTNETFEDEEELIPKNSTLIIARHPLPSGQKKVWEEESAAALLAASQAANAGVAGHGGVASFVSTFGDEGKSEEDKISTMMSNSTEMYDQRNWVAFRGKQAYGGKPPPKPFRCSKCHQSGHWPTDCGLADLKKTTGIPRSFLTPSTAETPGAKINPQGRSTTWSRDKRIVLNQNKNSSGLQVIFYCSFVCSGNKICVFYVLNLVIYKWNHKVKLNEDNQYNTKIVLRSTYFSKKYLANATPG